MNSRVIAIADALQERLIRAILGPKDPFERMKRTVFRASFVLIATVLAGPTILISIISNVERVRFENRDTVVDLIGRATDDTLIFAISVVVLYLVTLLANLYYARYVKAAVKAVDDLTRDISNLQ